MQGQPMLWDQGGAGQDGVKSPSTQNHPVCGSFTMTNGIWDKGVRTTENELGISKENWLAKGNSLSRKKMFGNHSVGFVQARCPWMDPSLISPRAFAQAPETFSAGDW